MAEGPQVPEESPRPETVYLHGDRRGSQELLGVSVCLCFQLQTPQHPRGTPKVKAQGAFGGWGQGGEIRGHLLSHEHIKPPKGDLQQLLSSHSAVSVVQLLFLLSLSSWGLSFTHPQSHPHPPVQEPH